MLKETFNATQPLEPHDKMYKYGIDPSRTVGATERARYEGGTDGQTDGRNETNIPPPPPPTTSLGRGGFNHINYIKSVTESW